MYTFSTPLAWLPLIELIVFIMVCGEIGFLTALLWIILSFMLGMWLLKQSGMKALSSSLEEEDAFFAVQDAFDSLCLMFAALLLIFPGFISDFMAIPLLLPPVRHWLFGRSKDNPQSFMHKFTKQSQGFRQWTYTKTTQHRPGETTIIEGEYTRVDDTEHLPKD